MDDIPLDANIQTYYTGLEVVWDPEKSAWLKLHRGASFEEIIFWKFLGIDVSPSRPHQDILYVHRDEYVWLVPCVEQEKIVFLKTAYPSRRHTKLWREKRNAWIPSN